MAGEDTERHEVPDIGADASSQLLEGLEKWTEYQVWVRAHTDVGPGPESAPVRMKTREDAPSAPPQDVHLVSLSSTSLKVSWVAPPAASRHGAIVRYTVSYQAMAGEDTERHEVPDIGADASSQLPEGLEK
ncbi:hypothetical protein CgunFtcFv8_007422 [Champsocephalus gunnari]|uniref:Fibronectin type-III domain-containing protein n=1 Tax=Champsocephalus gunnari TaxID=52237 RepID=A0AAN8CHH5_CHAGU|nr:hypothetical protein CgunFtcFv8_007422 [Champsocephalus gunnari]